MTGYGTGVYTSETCEISVEIRTLNSRYLELHIHPPKEFPQIEMEIKKKLKEVIKRGRVDLNCSIETPQEDSFEINTQAVARYIDLFTKLKKQFKLGGSLTISVLTQLPGVVNLKNNNVALHSDEFLRHLDTALAAAIRSVDKMRRDEGDAIKADLLSRLQVINRSLSAIEQEAGKNLEFYQAKLLQRLQDLTENLSLDEGRLIQEAAFYAERSDITEEITRLKSHLGQFHNLVESGNEIGKKLDFLLQEMNREITTILSKAAGSDVASQGITIKSEIEKIREQIQNIE